MGWLWDILVDDDDFVRRIQREIKRSEIIIEIERKIDMPLHSSPSDEIKQQIEKILRNYHVSTEDRNVYGHDVQFSLSEADVKKICQDVIINLRQEIYEEISRSKVNMENSWDGRLKEIVDRLQKLEGVVNTSATLTPMVESSIDLTPIQNAIKQIQREHQQIKQYIQQMELKANSPQTASVPVVDNNTNLQAQLDLQNREIETLKRNFIVQTQKYDTLKSAYDAQLRETDSLRQQISQQEQHLLKLDNQNGTLKRDLTDTKCQLESLQKQVEKLVDNPSMQTAHIPPSTDHISPKVIPWIKAFSLAKPTKPVVFFHGDGETVKTKFSQSIQEMDELITYLGQSKIEEPTRTSFMKNLHWCMEALEKLYGKFDFDECDADELSEEITGKFFKIISENLLDNVMVAIYRGGKEAIGYEGFLQSINRYLAKHGIYTEEIVPGAKLEGELLSNIEPPISKHTSVSTDNGKVDEVELLPYFMNYEDDDGNIDIVRKRGRVVCLKYGE